MTPVRVLMAGLLWRLSGRPASGDTLLEAFQGSDEQNRMLAGMSLVKAGERSFQLIEEQIAAGRATPRVLRLLPDIDESRARRVLSSVANTDGELSGVAGECLETLDRIAALDDTTP
jgi:radical SAM superfamily enzyme with C-terminal helix-hairpin-helix motif